MSKCLNLFVMSVLHDQNIYAIDCYSDDAIQNAFIKL